MNSPEEFDGIVNEPITPQEKETMDEIVSNNNDDQPEHQIEKATPPTNDSEESPPSTDGDQGSQTETPTPAVPPNTPPAPPKRRGRRPKNVANTDAKSSEETTKKTFANQFGLSTGFHVPSPMDMNFRIDDFRLSNDYSSGIDVIEVASPYEVRKPVRQEFFRVHPEEDYQITVAAMKEKIRMGERLWLVGSDLRAEFPEEIVPINLRLVITRENKLFLWPLNISSNGNSSPWSQTALQAAEMAKTAWVRLSSDTNEGRYRIFTAKGNLSEPAWPNLDFGKILELAFMGRVITDLNHPYLRQLRGEE